MNTILGSIKQFDLELFFAINNVHNAFFDVIMYWASGKLFWIPFYAVLLFFIIKVYRKFSIYILLAIALTITMSDQIASGIIKKTFKRLRPSHEPDLISLIHLSKAGPGGMYGFVSSHSANAFALITFLYFLLPKKYSWFKAVLLLWTLLVSYSRIYNGVHYPSDVVGGAGVGIFSGCIVWLLFKTILTKTKSAPINS